MLIVGAGFDSLSVSPLQLIGGRKTIHGWASGTAKDSEDTLQFSSLSGVRPMIERYPLEKAAEACEQMISGRAKFRVVLTMGGSSQPAAVSELAWKCGLAATGPGLLTRSTSTAELL